MDPVRTFGAAMAVMAVCFLLASLNWLQLLTIFFLACFAWSLWSWLNELENRRRQERLKRRKRFEQTSFARRREEAPAQSRLRPVAREGNVYQFPLFGAEGGADVSEAAD